MKTGTGDINRILTVLKNGGVIAYPTDTVYGLAAAADNADAVSKIFKLKKRSFDKALPLLVSDIDMILELCPGLDGETEGKIRLFPRGKVTFVLDSGIKRYPFQGSTVAVRMPDSEALIDVIKGLGCPLAATSANLAGEPELDSGDEISAVFQGELDLVVQGEPGGKKPSSIISFSGDMPELLRAGAFDKQLIRALTEIKTNVLIVCTGNTCRSPMGEAYVRHTAPGWVSVRSAGTDTANGLPPSEYSAKIIGETGEMPSSSARMSRDLYDWADVILTMEAYHRDKIDALYGSGKTFTLAEYASGGGVIGRNGKAAPGQSGVSADVPDPVGCSESVYRKAYEIIRRYVDAIRWK